MPITVTGHKVELTPALREYAEKKAAKLREFFKNIQKVEVVLDVRPNYDVDKRQVAELRVWLSGMKMIQAQEAGRDMYAAIDLAIDEAKRQVEKHKEKLGHERVRKAKKFKALSRFFSSWLGGGPEEQTGA